jgi:polyribonucleotide nucleotidyltransferase
MLSEKIELILELDSDMVQIFKLSGKKFKIAMIHILIAIGEIIDNIQKQSANVRKEIEFLIKILMQKWQVLMGSS